jgi:hypothetical protein
MEDGKKNAIMIGIIVVCLAVAAVVFIKTSSSDSESTAELKNQMIWIKCTDPTCGAEYEMNMLKYNNYVQKHLKPDAMQTPAMVCEKCGKETAYGAVKCSQCGTVFIKNSIFGKCPKCGAAAM